MPQRALGQNFSPFNNYIVAATTSSTNQVVVQPTLGQKCRDLTISNNSTGVAYIAWGQTTQTATSSNFAVLPGAIMTIDMGLNPVTNIAVLLATGSGNVYLSIGIGT